MEYLLSARYDSRASFYGKARVRTCGNVSTLTSYDTDVCRIRKTEDGKIVFRRLWDDWSATTGRHVHEFMLQNGYNTSGKKWWDSMPINKPVILVCNF